MKYLFFTAHLSTGGSPKYLEWLIKKIKLENNEIKVIEWNLYSDTYTVQRNLILNLVGADNFYSVGSYTEDDNNFYSKEQNVINYIKDFDPDFIHLNEFSENFAIKQLSSTIINFLYDKNKKHKLLETTHSARTNILNKKNIPDELWLVSKYQYDIAKTTNIKSVLMEMELPNRVRPNRHQTLISLGLDPDKIHVLQVGLFTINKNQKFTFDLAKNFINSNVIFHFIGNNCYIDECGIDKNQTNCKIWGERSDVDLFMSCMDLFVMPSHEELNPIALKEALSWGMTCFVSELSTIKDQYKNNKNLIFINENNLYNFIAEKLSLKKKDFNNSNFNIFTKYNLNIENNKIICSFFPVPKIEILGSENILYNIKFIDEITNITHYETKINTNMWTACNIQYFCKWKIVVTDTLYRTEKIFKVDLKDKLVKIINESSSLGDTIAWMSAVDEFQKLHNCKVDYYTCKKDLFSSEYKNINFYDYRAEIEKNYYAQYKIGCFSIKNESNLIKTDWRISNLQKIAFEILGLPYSEKKSKIQIPNKYILKCKYVCIATQSTSQSRYWNYNGGWEKIIDYIKAKGYKVICVDKHFSFGSGENINICPKNIDYFAGERPFEDIIDIINNCEFFIGLSSGLSWLAWALNKKIVKINGSVDSAFEFYTPYIVENKNVCNSCFTNSSHVFDPSNWSWCPENKNFECSRSIDESKVISKIDLIVNESKIIPRKIKIVHLQTTVNSENERKSKEFIEKFKNYGLEYVNYKNELYDGQDHMKNCLYPDLLAIDGPDKLTSRHYGCFSSYKKAILHEFTHEFDYVIMCEGDCLFEVDHEKFIDILYKIIEICDTNNINYFSFGDVKTLETKITQSQILSKPNDQDLCFITDKIIGIQCIMFSKKIKDTLINALNNEPWYIMDGWLNEFCWKNQINMGILFQRVTTQYSGESYIDKKHKNFNI